MASDFSEDPDELYSIVEELGRGQFGKVFKGVKKDTGEPVAIKCVPIDLDADEETFRPIAKEIQMLKDCNHPNIVGFYGAYIKENELWIVMEFCDAGSCAKMMTRMGKHLEEDQIAAVLYQTLLALEYLNNSKKIHRDIKADNILLKANGEAKVADLGVAAQLKNTSDYQKTATGTPYWMAPELVNEMKYNSKVDVWSLGITAIELAEKKPPLFEYLPMRALFMIAQETEKSPALASPKDWSPDFNDFIAKCLIRDPKQRWSATQLLAHPFIMKVKKQSQAILADLVHQFNTIMAQKRKEREAHSQGIGSSGVSVGGGPSSSSSGGLQAPSSPNNLRLRQKLTMVMAEDLLSTSNSGSSGGSGGSGNFGVGQSRPSVLHQLPVCEMFVTCERCSLQCEPKPWADLATTPLQHHASFNLPKLEVTKISDLVQLLKDPQEGLEIKTRTYKKIQYKKTFIGAEAVDWMVARLKINTRDAAVHLGEALMNRGIIEHVTHSEPFLDSRLSLYRFRSSKSRRNNVWYPDDKITYLVDMMRFALDIRTRTSRLAKYKNCFRGNELVDWLVKTLKLSREEAVEFGQELMRRSVFHHVTFSENFEDKPHLYRFYQDEKKFSQKRTENQGTSKKASKSGSTS
jgi:serine/threonine protein kinase/polyhydroxyalkanoate synthesis regulator phasin